MYLRLVNFLLRLSLVPSGFSSRRRLATLSPGTWMWCLNLSECHTALYPRSFPGPDISRSNISLSLRATSHEAGVLKLRDFLVTFFNFVFLFNLRFTFLSAFCFFIDVLLFYLCQFSPLLFTVLFFFNLCFLFFICFFFFYLSSFFLQFVFSFFNLCFPFHLCLTLLGPCKLPRATSVLKNR